MNKAKLSCLALLDSLWFACRELRSSRYSGSKSAPGAGVHGVGECGFDKFGGIFWPRFGQLGHSFWRAQEVTLFQRNLALLQSPCMDLGCGDFLFGDVAGFPDERVGIDYDMTSLVAGLKRSSRSHGLRADAGQLPFPDKVFQSCLSNSVLEHIPDLNACFREVYRILKPGGRFIFTFTLGEFCIQLSRLGGERDSNRWRKIFGIYQEPSENEILDCLRKVGFQIEMSQSYQPIDVTADFRYWCSPMVQFFERRMNPSRKAILAKQLAERVANTLDTTKPGTGACLFVIARRQD